jgi:uncharacterized damage-inducible protein DinB
MASLVRVFRGLLAYTMWADRLVLQALASLPEEDLARETGTSFGSVLGTMVHILGSEETWLARLLGTPDAALPGAPEVSDLESLRAGFEDLWSQLEVYLASLDEDQSGQDLEWADGGGEPRGVSFRQVLLHFVTHASYHRGQVVAQLRQLGWSAPSTDLVLWAGEL